jgi:glycosyltransferase involved in cell wall biosynthesis
LVPSARVHVSYLSRIPGANQYFRYLAPLYPRAFEAFDLSPYDAIVSSTSSWSKGVHFRPEAVHICFIHTVSRFLFDYDEYVGALAATRVGRIPDWLVRPVVDSLVRWDREAAKRPTRFVANSHAVAQRIREFYHREADVLHSPVDVDRFTVGAGRGDYFFIASRLLPYKRIDLAIDAARAAGVKLVVAGDGPAMSRLRLRARGSTTTLLGFVDDSAMNRLLGDAIAAIVPGEEDLGLVPVEAAAAGRPTIAYRAGGACETVIEGETGTFFDQPNADSLAAILRTFDPRRYDAARLRAHAVRFSPARFITGLREIVERTRAESS